MTGPGLGLWISGEKEEYNLQNKFYKPGPKKVPKSDYIFGIRAILEAIVAGKEIEKLLLQKTSGSSELMTELIQNAREHRIPMSRVPVEKLNRITGKNHQGAIAFLSAIRYANLENIVLNAFEAGKSPFILVLDRITDVRNFGAIARTAECAGVDGFLVPAKETAQIASDAIKTSAGALHHLAICRTWNLAESIQFLKNSGLQVMAISEKGKTSIFEQPLEGPLALILGSEEDGISEEALQLADHIVALPMHGKINSLNVSVAAGIAMYEVLRKRSLSSIS